VIVLGHLVEEPGAIQRDITRLTRTNAASVSGLCRGWSAFVPVLAAAFCLEQLVRAEGPRARR
jgi:hypothetical protein